MKLWITALALVIGLALPVFAQSNSGQQQQQSNQPSQSSSQGSSTQKNTTTTTTTNPTEVTRTTQRTTGVDPIWLVVGGIALLAIVLVAILSMRRRGGDTVVRESKTVIKE
jgi:predicted histidine transporter YuiF (NhaC family)